MFALSAVEIRGRRPCPHQFPPQAGGRAFAGAFAARAGGDPGPTACPSCNGKLAKLGDDVAETLELIPRQWRVIQTVRERFTYCACETITQPPAPFHPIARGLALPELLPMILEAKFR